MKRTKTILRKIKNISSIAKGCKNTRHKSLAFYKDTKQLYSKYLDSGIYLLRINSKSILHRIDLKSINFKKSMFKNNDYSKENIFSRYLKKTIRFLIFPKFKFLLIRGSKKKVFNGQLIYLTADSISYKIYDFKNLEILTINNQSLDLSKLIKNPILVSDKISTPELTINVSKDLIYEKLVLGLTFKELSYPDKKIYFKNIVSQFQEFGMESNYKNNNIQIRDMLKKYNFDIKFYSKEIRISLERLKQIRFPMIKIHGDFHGENIICKDGIANLIDFEFSNFNLFFVDIFYLIYKDKYLFKIRQTQWMNKVLNDYFKFFLLDYNKYLVDDFIIISRLLVKLEINFKRGIEVKQEEILI